MTLDRAYLDEIAAWNQQQATDPCAARGHSCRCPDPDIAAFVARLNAEHHAEQLAQEKRFRALFTPAETPSLRERLAELEAASARIDPLLQLLDATWHALETDLGWRGQQRSVP